MMDELWDRLIFVALDGIVDDEIEVWRRTEMLFIDKEEERIRRMGYVWRFPEGWGVCDGDGGWCCALAPNIAADSQPRGLAALSWPLWFPIHGRDVQVTRTDAPARYFLAESAAKPRIRVILGIVMNDDGCFRCQTLNGYLLLILK